MHGGVTCSIAFSRPGLHLSFACSRYLQLTGFGLAAVRDPCVAYQHTNIRWHAFTVHARQQADGSRCGSAQPRRTCPSSLHPIADMFDAPNS